MLFGGPRRRALKILKNSKIDPRDRLQINPKPLLDKFTKKELADKSFLKSEYFGLDLINDLDANYYYKESDEMKKRYKECAYRFDAKFYLVLTCTPASLPTVKPIGICLAGFKFGIGIGGVRKTLFVVQIQGLRCGGEFTYSLVGKEVLKILGSIRWEKLLITALEQWAKRIGFKKIGIQKAECNYYFLHGRPDDSKNWRLKMHYDVTAQRMGYKAARGSNYFFKKLL